VRGRQAREPEPRDTLDTYVGLLLLEQVKTVTTKEEVTRYDTGGNAHPQKEIVLGGERERPDPTGRKTTY